MKKMLIFLSAISFSSSQIHSVTPRVAVAGTALTAALAAANVYRSSQKSSRNSFFDLNKETRVQLAIAFGFVATAGVGIALHQATPLVRLERATNMLARAQLAPLLKHHPLTATPELLFLEMQKFYASSAFPAAKAFEDLKTNKQESTNAIMLIEKARKDVTEPCFGRHIITESKEINEKFDGLMIAVKEYPDFVAQYSAKKKIKADKEMANAASTIAAAQVVQTVNSFSHHRHQ